MFDFRSFIENIVSVQRRTFDDGDSEKYFGLRFVVETARGEKSIWHLFNEEQLQILIEPLFPSLENPEDEEWFKDFYLLVIPGVATEDIQQNIYDVAYGLMTMGEFISVEPDRPYSLFYPQGTDFVKASGSPPADYAWALRAIKADKAWGLIPANGMKDGQGISIAHLDTGWTDHVDLDKANFDSSRFKDLIDQNGDARDPLNYLGNPGHGTKTGSVIMSKGGLTPNTSDTVGPGKITGVAREADYISVRCIKKSLVYIR